jgi:hypothetical protein
MSRYYIRFAFRNSGWCGVIKREGAHWKFGNGNRGAPVAMTEQQALDGLRSAPVRSLRVLARNENDDLEIKVIKHGKGAVMEKSWFHGPLSAIAAAAR